MEGIAQKAGMKLFEKHVQQYQPADPLYETYTDKKGRTKRRKRELPPGLSKRDAAILKSVKRRAHYLDKGFKVCGMRFGWTFIIGIIPGAGDVADASLNYFLVLRKCQKANLPSWLMKKMLVNNLISAGVGFVPLVGDVVLAQWKANSRNAALLEEFLRIRGEEFLKQQSSLRPGANASADAAAIQPGAGMEVGERIPKPNKKKDAIPAHKVPVEERARIAEKQGTTDHAPSGAQVQSSGSSSSWWKGKGKAKSVGPNATGTTSASTRADKGKFVENVDR